MSSLVATNGDLNREGRHTVASFSATLGQDSWNGMVGERGRFNFCCVWTGNNNSPPQEWWHPWKGNVDEAVRRGHTLMVVAHLDHPDSQFSHTLAVGSTQRFRLGKGQIAEVAYMNRKGYNYKVIAVSGLSAESSRTEC